MKKFKLLTSLSTLAIVGTTMPIVATACNDDETTTKVKSITYAELKSLQDSNNLEEGQLYRITDYKATTTQTHSEAANNQFDLIVEANSKSTINENATAVLHENDTYFANSDLSKWEIKYSLNNDKTKYAWADENGYGVIYYMKDEFNNEAPYDFKNIKFNAFTGTEVVEEKIVPKYTSETYYTFSSLYSPIEPTTDLSLNGYTNQVYANKIEPAYQTTADATTVQVLNNIVFNNAAECFANSFGVDCHDMTFGNKAHDNKFGANCYYITAEEKFESNTFEGNDYQFTMKNEIEGNTFGTSNHDFTIAKTCKYNNFGKECYTISLDSTCNWNSIGNKCYELQLGSSCTYNTFADYCNTDTLGQSCASNIFGHEFNENTLGDYCIGNCFGNQCQKNILCNMVKYNNLGNSCSNNYFGKFASNNTLKDNCSYITLGNYSESSMQYEYIDGNIFGANCSYIKIGLDAVPETDWTFKNNTIINTTRTQSTKWVYNTSGTIGAVFDNGEQVYPPVPPSLR